MPIEVVTIGLPPPEELPHSERYARPLHDRPRELGTCLVQPSAVPYVSDHRHMGRRLYELLSGAVGLLAGIRG
jgi:hypothetical protein